MVYRSEIDGLRALAVLVVVIFHLGTPGFDGGFIGVDVFFVISGYLITGLILDRFSAGNFSFADFYLRRIRRLLPALLVTVGLTALAAALFLTPYDYRFFSRSALAALFSVSNLLFFSEAGYWDADSDLKPLLHTWSLGVEEQFYLFWPALVILALHWGGRRLLHSFLVVTVVFGSAAAAYMTSIDPAAAFYLFPFRMSQFALGALVPWICSRSPVRSVGGRVGGTDLMALSGLACIAYSSVSFGAETAFPGSAALVPSVGAALVLIAIRGEAPGILLAGLRHPVCVWLGKTSYSLYLVHWPIVALYRYHFRTNPAPRDQLLLFVVMLALGAVLHYGVERRFYRRAGESRLSRPALDNRRFALRLAGVLALLCVLPASGWYSGWEWRFPRMTLSADAIEAGKRRRFVDSRGACSLRDDNWRACATGPVSVLVLGHSHEVDGFNFLNAVYRDDPEVKLVRFGGILECRPVSVREGRPSTANSDCQQRFDALLSATTAEAFDVLVVSASDRAFSQTNRSFLVTLRRLRELNPKLRVITFGSYLQTRYPCARLINESGSPRACSSPDNVSYFEADAESEPLFEDFMTLTDLYIDRVALLCRQRVLQTCAVQTPEGVPVFYDRHHFSLEFAHYAGRRYRREVGDPVRLALAADE